MTKTKRISCFSQLIPPTPSNFPNKHRHPHNPPNRPCVPYRPSHRSLSLPTSPSSHQVATKRGSHPDLHRTSAQPGNAIPQFSVSRSCILPETHTLLSSQKHRPFRTGLSRTCRTRQGPLTNALRTSLSHAPVHHASSERPCAHRIQIPSGAPGPPGSHTRRTSRTSSARGASHRAQDDVGGLRAGCGTHGHYGLQWLDAGVVSKVRMP